MHLEKLFSAKVTIPVVPFAVAIGAYFITIEQYRLAEGCFILAAFWSSIFVSLRPYFTAPFDAKKELYLWAAASVPLIGACAIFYLTEQYRTNRILSANEGWLVPADEGSCAKLSFLPDFVPDPRIIASCGSVLRPSQRTSFPKM
jgi:hypothetical protein